MPICFGFNMTDKDQFDGFMRIAELRTHRATNRQTYEWRVTFGLWAIITASTLYLKDRPIPLWFGVCISVIYAFFWLRPIYVAHKRDNWTAEYYLEVAISVLNPGRAPPSPPDRKDVTWLQWSFGFLGEWGCIFQFLGTAALIYFFYLTTFPNALPHFLRAN